MAPRKNEKTPPTKIAIPRFIAKARGSQADSDILWRQTTLPKRLPRHSSDRCRLFEAETLLRL